jgi:hypothetical protein
VGPGQNASLIQIPHNAVSLFPAHAWNLNNNIFE